MTKPHSKDSISPGLEPVIVGFVAFLFYAVMGARHLQWGDPAKLMLYVHDHVFLFSQEEHVGHILWSWPFSLLPIEPFSWRMRLSSAFTMGAAIGIGHATLLRLGIARTAARAAMTSVAVAHTIWFTGSLFETYGLVLLTLAAASWLILAARQYLLAGVLLGFGVTVHPITLFGLPGISFGLWKSSHGWRSVARLAGGVVLGGALVLLLVFVMRPHDTPLTALNWVSASNRYGGLRFVQRNGLLLIAYLAFNFSGLALALLFVGAKRLTPHVRRTALLFAVPHYVVALFWLPQRSYLIPIPVYFVSAYVIGLGAERLLQSQQWVRFVLMPALVTVPVLTYAFAPPVFQHFQLDRTIRDAPYRNEATYFLRPWKFSETSARDYVADLGRVLPGGSVVVGDWVLYTTVNYAHRVEGWREDITLINADVEYCDTMVEEFRAGRRLFVLDDEPGYLPECLTRLGSMIPIPEIESLTELVASGSNAR